LHITGKNLTVLSRKKNNRFNPASLVTGHTSPESLSTKFQKKCGRELMGNVLDERISKGQFVFLDFGKQIKADVSDTHKQAQK
jgi:hypothetical protein